VFDHFSDIPQRLNFAVLQNLYRFEFDYENVTFAESLFATVNGLQKLLI
jgi:hypothetical protein